MCICTDIYLPIYLNIHNYSSSMFSSRGIPTPQLTSSTRRSSAR